MIFGDWRGSLYGDVWASWMTERFPLRPNVVFNTERTEFAEDKRRSFAGTAAKSC